VFAYSKVSELNVSPDKNDWLVDCMLKKPPDEDVSRGNRAVPVDSLDQRGWTFFD
jgi:hypothetical protein